MTLAARRHDAENTEYGERGGDRNDFRHGHPVEAVHEIHEIDEPQAADDERKALDPPRQQGNDAQFGRQRQDHRRDGERLQQQPRRDDRSDGCRPCMPTPAIRMTAANNVVSGTVPAAPAAQTNKAPPLTAIVAAMTAMPPPCGVGILCDERALGAPSRSAQAADAERRSERHTERRDSDELRRRAAPESRQLAVHRRPLKSVSCSRNALA